MWKPYLKVIAKKAGSALHTLDRFHIMAHLSEAIEEVRAGEVKELKGEWLCSGANEEPLVVAQASREYDQSCATQALALAMRSRDATLVT